MAGSVLGYLTTAGSLRGQKRKGKTPTGGFGIAYMVSRTSFRQVRKPVEWCCSCNQKSTCSTTSPSARAYECCNSGQQCTGCYCWGRCKNRVRMMLYPTKPRVMLGHFPCSADPPAIDQYASPLPVQSLTSSSSQAISAGRSGGGGARGGAGRRKSLSDSGGGGRGSGRENQGQSRGEAQKGGDGDGNER